MTTSHGGPGAADVTLRSWPRLGDLALDTAQRGRVGVIVGVPGEEGSDWLTYHLRPIGGGTEWSAAADASTLQPVPSPVTHATALEGPVHDRPGRHWALKIRVHHEDGSEQNCPLILAEDQAWRLIAQIRDQAASRQGWTAADILADTDEPPDDLPHVAAFLEDLREIGENCASAASAASAPAAFFAWLASTLPVTSAASLVITHLLPGQMEFLSALGHTTRIAAVLPKPKSANEFVLEETARVYRCDELDRVRFADPDWLVGYIRSRAEGRRVVLVDIGGYFAPALQELCVRLPGQVAGVVEDTENGQRRYEALPELPCPVFSVARSPLKEPEDRLVGQAIVFSVETLLRHLGEVMQGRQACVLGYGKIGAGIAAALHSRHVRVLVLDTDPVRQAQALSVGYASADLTEALACSDLVFSATGNRALSAKHLPLLKEGAFLAGATSRDDEFDLGGLLEPGSGYLRSSILPGVSRIRSQNGRSFFLLGNGNAVNFLHTSAMGSAIHLVKAEMTVAAALLAEQPHLPGFYEVAPAQRASIAAAWVDMFGPRPGRHL
ncbi:MULTISPECIES: adenosylhomocysteinase [Frankia]|uniref:adenosylhomocysteinase n=1 Tax=Frankia TaxID=1854 RepID=UPI0021196EBB|nr:MULTISPECIES: adenosylhomocysteinase [Frankia]